MVEAAGAGPAGVAVKREAKGLGGGWETDGEAADALATRAGSLAAGRLIKRASSGETGAMKMPGQTR